MVHRVHVLHVPQSRAADLFRACPPAQPPGRWNIDTWASGVAQQRDGIGLDHATDAVRASIVGHVQPQHAHGSNHTAHGSLEPGLPVTGLSGCTRPHAPGELRLGMKSASKQRMTDMQAEYRRPVVTSPPAARSGSLVLFETPPQRGPAAGAQGMGAHSYDTRPSTISALLALLEEEVDSAARPCHPASALCEHPQWTSTLLKSFEQDVEVVHVSVTSHKDMRSDHDGRSQVTTMSPAMMTVGQYEQ